MIGAPLDIRAVADQVIAECRAADEPHAKRRDAMGVVARLRIAISPVLLHAVVAESEIGTDPQHFAQGADCVLASIASTLAGYLSGGGIAETQHNASLLLLNAAETVRREPDQAIGVTVERVERGGLDQ